MQSNLFEPEHLPQLPPSSALDHWIYESPIPLALACVAIGILVFGVLRHTKHAKAVGRPTAALGIVLGIAVFSIGSLVTTDSELLRSKSALLITAAATGDESTLRTLLDDQVRIKSSFVTRVGKEQIINLSVSRAAPMIESASAKEIRAGIYGPLVARTHVKVKVKADMIPPLSWWLIDWTKPDPESDQWVVTDIEPMWIQGYSNSISSD